MKYTLMNRKKNGLAIVMVIGLIMMFNYLLGSAHISCVAYTDPVPLILGESQDFTLTSSEPGLTLRLEAPRDQFDLRKVRFYSSSGLVVDQLDLTAISPASEYRLFHNISYYHCQIEYNMTGYIFEKIGVGSEPLDLTFQLKSGLNSLTFSVRADDDIGKHFFTLSANRTSMEEYFGATGSYHEFIYRFIVFANSTSPSTLHLQTTYPNGSIDIDWGPKVIQPGEIILFNHSFPAFPGSAPNTVPPNFSQLKATWDLTNLNGTVKGYRQHISILAIYQDLYNSLCPSQSQFPTGTIDLEGGLILSALALMSTVILIHKRRGKNE